MKLFNLSKSKSKKSKEEVSFSSPNYHSNTESSHSAKMEDSVGQSHEPNTNSKEMENFTKIENPTDAPASNSKTVHNLIILDESGSMRMIYMPALSGVNETLQTIRAAEKEHEGQKHFVSLITFDTERYNQIYSNTPAEETVDITQEQYRPGGCTPLYDAMGRAITNLRDKVEKDDTVLVTIITDGMENASKEYSGPVIKALVEEMKAQGWVFTYIGANQDVEAVANSMSIGNCLAFDANIESTKKMFIKEMRARKKFFGKLQDNVPKDSLNEDYFVDVD